MAKARALDKRRKAVRNELSSEDKKWPRLVYSLSKIVLLESPGN